ncbi:MAG: sialidase family protein [Hylemonella sp.]|nr:sialidase family protein [Hylemonella sp.]
MSRLSFSWLYRSAARRCWAGLGLCLLLTAVECWQRAPASVAPQAVWPSGAQAATGRLVLQAAGRVPMPVNTPAAHASTLLAMPPDHPAALQAYWFAGSRESGPDVQIAMSRFDRASQQWSPAAYVVNRQSAADTLGFGLRRLGNPVAWRDAQGRTHLFVVATGLGGWAAGRILHLRQDAPHEPFQPLRVLPLSWVWNTSHLVRAMPLPLADGGMVLPVYFEIGVKYPVALRFDAAGEFRGMTRMSQRRDLLQPTLLARSETEWLALLRDNRADRKLRAVLTHDGGRSWLDLPDPGPANPDAAVAGLALRSDLMFLAHNPRAESRAQLVLSQSRDGLEWTVLETLAQAAPGREMSYPSMAWADDSLWVSYTEQRQAIAWQRFMLVPLAR